VALARRLAKIALVVDRDHYDELVLGAITKARTQLWISTANLKELWIEAPIGSVARARGRFQSILEALSDLSKRDVEIRVLHASVPSGPFRAALARRKRIPRLEMRRCPRVHMKVIVVDGEVLYLGSANFTGAGLGAKGDGRRNFEMGVMTDDEVLLDQSQARFDRVWSGKECGGCKLRRECPAPIDLLLSSRRSTSAR
jgi:phosphatidylserine/phosphatidylglycerophosphate/cardiolipin synthase-like enzyme